jgi:hypothetical protein
MSRRVAIVGATAADLRDVLVEGPSGLLSVSPPWFTPRYEPSKRRLSWPNGATAALYSAQEPDRLRGPQHDCALLDETAAWDRPEAYDMLLFGLRIGRNPQCCIATTPKATPLIRRLVDDSTVVQTGGSTFENERHLAPEFIKDVTALYEGTRLGRQEIYAEILELTESVWFTGFDRARHVTDKSEYRHGMPVHLAIDAGVSQHTGAVFFHAIPDMHYKFRIHVFGDFFSSGTYSAKTAQMIKDRGMELPCRGVIDRICLDPASGANTGIGPVAFSEYQAVFGSQITKWPLHQVVDGLDTIEVLLDHNCLLIHPRATHLIDAFINYRRDMRGGIVINRPAPIQNPHEDMMDALRGALRDVMPSGRVPGPTLMRVPARILTS